MSTRASSSGIEDDFIPIISYDAISEYYCNKLYPKLNELERKLRKLMFNIYTLNFGKSYYSATTTKEMQSKAKGIIRAKGNAPKREIAYIQQFFYSLEYSDIQELLFHPRWTPLDEQKKQKFLSSHDDLSKLPDSELRSAINDISPKSDWDRFFSEKFHDKDVETDIEEIRHVRNSVAHCKFFGKTEYTRCNKIVRNLSKALDVAITITEEQDFINKNTELLRESLSNVADRFSTYRKTMNDILSCITPSVQLFSQVLSSSTLNSFKSSLKLASQASEEIRKAIGAHDYYSTIFSSLSKSMHDFYSTFYIEAVDHPYDPAEDDPSDNQDDSAATDNN